MNLNLESDICFFGAWALVEQALNNVIDNAIRFTPVDGDIWIDASQAGESVYCAIEDSGPGLSPALKRVIFARFKCGESPGSVGLGLSIARGIVEAHGGELQVEAGHYASGARFSINFSVHLSNLKDS